MKTYRYEEIQVGLCFSIKKKVTKQTINEFIKITDDRHPLHADIEFSKETGFRDIIAHGMLTSSLSSALVGMYLPGLYGLLLSQTFNYLKPVHPGETLNITGTVTKKVDSTSVIIIEVEIKNEKDEIVAKGYIQTMVRR